jgi:hypothetical protein
MVKMIGEDNKIVSKRMVHKEALKRYFAVKER